MTQLAADLVMTSGEEFDFKEIIAFRCLDKSIFESGYFSFRPLADLGFVLLFVSDKAVT